MKPAAFTLVNSQTLASLSIDDRGLAYGDGVFETMRVYQGDIALWQYHYERLEQGLHTLQIALDPVSFKDHIAKTQQAIGQASGVCKLTVTRGEGGRGYQPAASCLPTIITQFFPFDDAFLQENKNNQQQGVAVHCCNTSLPINPLLAGLKTLNQLPYVLASQERLSLNVKEGIVFNTEGQLIEATARNIFLVKNGEIYTPVLSQCGVSGVMRRLLIEKIAPQLGLTINSSALVKEDFFSAEEVFLTNGISQVWPVTSCEGQCWSIGTVTQAVQAEIAHFLENGSPFSLSKVF